jgi:hypothetical protein
MSSPPEKTSTTPSGISNVFAYLKGLYTNYSTNTADQRTIAIALPVIALIVLVFLALLITLIVKRRQLKAKLNQVPDGSPPVSIAQAEIIPRPSSVV